MVCIRPAKKAGGEGLDGGGAFMKDWGMVRVFALRFVLLLALVPGWAGRAWAVPVELRTVRVSAAEPGFSQEAAAAGPVAPGQGWKVAGEAAESDQWAIFQTPSPVAARLLLIQLFFPGPEADSSFGKFGVDVTTDARPFPEGRWMPLILEAASVADPTVALPAVPTVTLPRQAVPYATTLRSRAPFDGITAFRLRVFTEPREGAPAKLGRGAAGAFLLGGFRVETDAPQSSNIALGRQVYCSRQVQPGLPSRNLTDGFHATWSQPALDGAQPDAFFQLDLGQLTRLDHVVMRRQQGSGMEPPPDGYTVELLTESGGFAGGMVWSARRGAAQAGMAADVIRAADGQGEFAGRSLMIQVRGGKGDQPRIAELEVYPALAAEPGFWQSDGRVLTDSGRLEIPPGARRVSFVPLCRKAAEGVVMCRWRMQGWDAAWHEAVLGSTVELPGIPPPGDYQLEVQARHTDGLWDTSGRAVPVRAEPPWWSHAPSAVAALSGTVVLAGTASWWWFARRMRRRLRKTEEHLELHRDRLRISRDMHDEIGARLTSIALLAERTQRQAEASPGLLDDIAQQARTTVEALDTIVWAVNPRHDTVGGLQDYLCDYAPSWLSAAGMECVLDFRVSLPDRPLALAVRHHLLMAAKEALQNAVKHSGGTRCELVLTDRDNRLELRISVDGRGFGSGGVVGITHTGMVAILQRLTESGGTCEFLPGPDGRGAGVRLTVPLEAF
ncbi:MAG: putative Histidine kinase [Verrucomicrobiales bacterium]|nr:putative Histidine kinase [Verrucomicrobiales bacterium]